MQIFNDKRRYLLVVAILILVGFCLFFNYVFKANEDVLVREKAFEKQQDLWLLNGIIDKLVELDMANGNHQSHEEILKYAIQFTEANFNSTFAQAYDADLIPLTPLHLGVGGGRKHNPLDYAEFVDAVQNNEFGSLVYSYTTEQAGHREIYMAYRWMPSNPEYPKRYLVAVGISKFTINEQIDTMAIYGAVALIILAGFYIMGCTVLIVRLGDIYDRRQNDKQNDERRE